MADGVSQIHDARGFTTGPVKGDDRDVARLEGRSDEPRKHRFGSHLDEGANTGFIEMLDRFLKPDRRSQLSTQQICALCRIGRVGRRRYIGIYRYSGGGEC